MQAPTLIPVGSLLVELFLEQVASAEQAGRLTPVMAVAALGHLYGLQAKVRQAALLPHEAARRAAQIVDMAERGALDVDR
jgi:hypothetical protein